MTEQSGKSHEIKLGPSPTKGKALDEKLSKDELEAFYDRSSHRSTAIVLGAIVENRLTSLLRLLMRRSNPSDMELADELFNPSGPLGPFGTKIRIAYMLRIISEPSYKDLMIINKIRNKFAHDLSIKSFDDQQITAWIKNMHMYSIVKRMSEEGRERLKNRTSDNEPGLAAAYVKSHMLSSSRDAYRESVRFIIHHIVDYENAITAKEEELNRQQPASTDASPPDKS